MSLLLLCFRYPSQDVYCSEQSSAGPAQPAGDGTHGSQEQEQEPDSTQHKVCPGFLQNHTSSAEILKTCLSVFIVI